MNIQCPVRRQCDHVVAEQLSICHDHANFRIQSSQVGEKGITARTFRLKYRNPFFVRHTLDRWRNHRVAVTRIRRIGLRHHANNVVPFA